MFKIRFALNALASLVFTLALASLAKAYPQTYVSTSGSDSNATCDRTTPCRTFNTAAQRTDAGGDIIALDSGEYGQFTISSPVSVTAAPGVHAQITATSGNGINISAATGWVVLRGLAIRGRGLGVHGINYTGGATLQIENCVIDGFTVNGINFVAGGFSKLFVEDTIIRNNGIPYASGIFIATSNNDYNPQVTLDHCRIENNGNGVVIDGGQVTIRDSIAASNSYSGFWARASNNDAVTLMIENCMTTNNKFGIRAGTPTSYAPIVRVSSTVIVGNWAGVYPERGELLSFGNNRLAGNSADDGRFTGWGIGLK